MYSDVKNKLDSTYQALIWQKAQFYGSLWDSEVQKNLNYLCSHFVTKSNTRGIKTNVGITNPGDTHKHLNVMAINFISELQQIWTP